MSHLTEEQKNMIKEYLVQSEKIMREQKEFSEQLPMFLEELQTRPDAKEMALEFVNIIVDAYREEMQRQRKAQAEALIETVVKATGTDQARLGAAVAQDERILERKDSLQFLEKVVQAKGAEQVRVGAAVALNTKILEREDGELKLCPWQEPYVAEMADEIKAIMGNDTAANSQENVTLQKTKPYQTSRK